LALEKLYFFKFFFSYGVKVSKNRKIKKPVKNYGIQKKNRKKKKNLKQIKINITIKKKINK